MWTAKTKTKPNQTKPRQTPQQDLSKYRLEVWCSGGLKFFRTIWASGGILNRSQSVLQILSQDFVEVTNCQAFFQTQEKTS